MRITEKHSLTLRLVHWLNIPFLCLMIWSGILIYWANDIYPGFFPEWFYETFNLSSRLADGMAVHYLVGWAFVLNGLVYLTWFFTSGHWREVLPKMRDFKNAGPTVLHDFGLVKTAPAQGKFNSVQKIAYSGAIVMGTLVTLSGFAIYKPVQLWWLTTLFGGYEGARLVHFVMMLLLCLFTFVHVVQVIRAGWNNFRAMVAGFEVEND